MYSLITRMESIFGLQQIIQIVFQHIFLSISSATRFDPLEEPRQPSWTAWGPPGWQHRLPGALGSGHLAQPLSSRGIAQLGWAGLGQGQGSRGQSLAVSRTSPQAKSGPFVGWIRPAGLLFDMSGLEYIIQTSMNECMV